MIYFYLIFFYIKFLFRKRELKELKFKEYIILLINSYEKRQKNIEKQQKEILKLEEYLKYVELYYFLDKEYKYILHKLDILYKIKKYVNKNG